MNLTFISTMSQRMKLWKYCSIREKIDLEARTHEYRSVGLPMDDICE